VWPRGIPVSDAVLVKALIPKSGIFAGILQRDEFEVLLDPAHLQKVSVAPYRNRSQILTA
jgi:hypothetical protein